MSSYKKYSDLGDGTSKPRENSAPTQDMDHNDPVIYIEDENHKRFLVANARVVVVDVYGDWCMPCMQIAPRFAKLANDYKKFGFIFAKEDVDKKISQNVRGVPNFQYFVNGNLFGMTSGADMAEVTSKLEEIKSVVMSGVAPTPPPKK